MAELENGIVDQLLDAALELRAVELPSLADAVDHAREIVVAVVLERQAELGLALGGRNGAKVHA